MYLYKVSNPRRSPPNRCGNRGVRGRREGERRKCPLRLWPSRPREGVHSGRDETIKDQRNVRRVGISPITASTAGGAQGEWGQRPFPPGPAVSAAGAADLPAKKPVRGGDLRGAAA